MADRTRSDRGAFTLATVAALVSAVLLYQGDTAPYLESCCGGQEHR